MASKTTEAAPGEILPTNFRRIEGTNLYRSSKLTTPNIVSALTDRNITTILDLREETEGNLGKDKELAQMYTPYTQIPDVNGKMGKLQLSQTPNSKDPRERIQSQGKHIVIPLLIQRHIIMKADVGTSVKLWAGFLQQIDRLINTHLCRNYVVGNIVCKDGDAHLLALYKFIIDNSGPQLYTALKLLSQPDRVPALVCCSLGKDRTGVLSMLLGHVCGRTKEQLIQDYTLSQEYFDEDPRLLQGVDAVGLNPAYKEAPASAMSETLEYIEEKYGSLDKYLDGIGFHGDYRNDLKQNIQA